jgi:indolepyruvate decarboxylase
MNIADYLVHRLQEIGIHKLFSVPGDYTLGLLDHFLPSNIQLVGTCNELNAAYAADGYARVNGVGALCVTYCVGGLSALNGVAGSFAERVPVVVVTGGPSLAQRAQRRMVHHTSGEFTAQLEAFLPVTVGARILENADYAAAQIDELLILCLHHKRPVYIELPTDVLRLECGEPGPLSLGLPPSSPDVLARAVEEARMRITGARRPVVLSGVEILRYHLEDKVARLCHRAGLPFGTGLLGKTSVDESADGYYGIYQGGLSRPEVQSLVEESDALLILGGWLADSSTGGFSHGGDDEDVISANVGRVRFGKRVMEPIALDAFIDALTDALPERTRAVSGPAPRVYGREPYTVQPGAPIRMSRLMDRLQDFIGQSTILLAETGDAIFWSADLQMPAVDSYIAQAYYLSIGYTIPATLGVALAAPTSKRVVTLVGDGAFQMTCQELSTIVRAGLTPIVIVLNNDGYSVERAIHDGPYNEIARWKYHKITEVVGGRGYEVKTEDQLELALGEAVGNRELTVIEVRIERDDISPTFRRFAKIISARNVSG